MYEVDGIVYAGEPAAEVEVEAVTPLEDMMMLVRFATGETRLFDATVLLEGPAFAPLRDEAVFGSPKVELGACTWMDGALDVAPEFMYARSYEYGMTA